MKNLITRTDRGDKEKRLRSKNNHAEGVYIINAKHCISSAHRAVYHQAAGKYTLARDEIQGRHAALDDIHDCVVMICQACGLDKKILKAELSGFLSRVDKKDAY